MHYRPVLALALLQSLACGPGAPADTADSSTASDGGDTTTPTTDAPEPPTTTDPAMTSDPGTGPTTDAPEPTTGEPVICPEGQPRWSALASMALTVADDVILPLRTHSVVPMLDGDLALAAATAAPGQSAALVRLSAVGAVLGLEVGAPSEVGPARTLAVQRAADGGLVLLGTRTVDEVTQPFLARFAADGAPAGEVALAAGRRPAHALALVDGAAVLTGDDTILDKRVVFKVDVETGAELWWNELAGPPDLSTSAITVGPQGELVAGGMAIAEEGGFTSLHLWRVADDGAIVWSHPVDMLPFDLVVDLAATPDGQLVALHLGTSPDHNVGLLAADLASGETLWQREVAVTDASGRPLATRLHVDADGLTIPVARSVPEMLSRAAVEVRRVSFTGEPLETIALPEIPAGLDSFAFLASARGACGELVIVVGDQEPWFAAFAP